MRTMRWAPLVLFSMALGITAGCHPEVELPPLPEAKISIPSGGSDDPVKGSISDTGPDILQVPNDLDYGLREVLVGTKAFHPGRLFTIQFHDCEGATAPAASELHCSVEDASDSAGAHVPDLHCSVRNP